MKHILFQKKSGNKIFEIDLNNKFTNKGIFKIKANYDNNFSRIYTFRNNDDVLKVITQIDANFDEFEIDAVDSSNIKISITLVDKTFELYQGTIQIKYYDSNYKIDMIQKIEKNITSNLKEINNLKNNKTYLKNLYNILFYNSKTQVTFTILFYQNFFNLNANKNDFIEVSFKMLLETGNASLSQYVIVNQEILDDNNISLFKKSTALNRFKHSSNKIVINANFVYHFKKDVKKLKFILYFTRTYNQYLDLHYIVNKDYKLILKHYSP